MKTGKHLLLITLVLAVVVSPLMAGTFERVGLEKLVRTSKAAIEGEVLSTSSFWDSEGRIIVTEAVVYVQDRVFGDAGSLVKLKTFGGTVGNYTVEAPGFPTFEKGERLFLFVRDDEFDSGMLRVTGYQQGQFHIVTGVDKVARAESAIDAGANLVSAGAPAKLLPEVMPLSELKELVREEVQIMQLEQSKGN